MYKVADMFISGKGCLKNPAAGAKIILSMYSDNLDIFCDGGFDGKLADVALRVGGLFEKGIGVEQSIENAFNFYLEAKLAIDKRVDLYDFYGDGKVQKNIEESIERVRLQLPEDFFKKGISMDHPEPIGLLLSKSAGLDLTLEAISGGYKLKAKGFASESASAQIILNEPEMNYCKLVDEVELVLDSGAEILTDISEMPYNAFITSIVHEEDNVWNFMFGDMVMLAVKTEGFVFKGDE